MKIACIGNIVYDTTVSGEYFIKEGERNSFDNAQFNTGGPASNAASVLAKYGNQVHFYGQIGNDSQGNYVWQEMHNENIDMENVNISNEIMTPQGFIIINKSGQTRTICSLRSPSDYKKPKIQNIRYNTGYDFILTDGKYYEDTIKLFEANPNAITIIDAGRSNDEVKALCKKVNYIICSEDFANGVTGLRLNGNYENDCKVFITLQNMYPQSRVTITVGARGYIYEENDSVIFKPAFAPEIPTIDTNGAGDIFHGAFTHALANGYTYSDSLSFANVVAAISTTRRGGRSSIPDLDEVEKNITKGQPYTRKLKK